MVGNADDVTSPCFLGKLAVGGKEEYRVGDCHRFFAAHMGQLHAAFEVARGHAHKGNTVTMFWIHVGLDLENKARNLGFFGGDVARLGFLDLRLRAVLADAVHELLNAEAVDGGAKPDRGHMAFKDRLGNELREQFTGHFDLFQKLLEQVLGQVLRQFWVI